jgi:hypothetical protein
MCQLAGHGLPPPGRRKGVRVDTLMKQKDRLQCCSVILLSGLQLMNRNNSRVGIDLYMFFFLIGLL